jgi:hypothetical protein
MPIKKKTPNGPYSDPNLPFTNAERLRLVKLDLSYRTAAASGSGEQCQKLGEEIHSIFQGMYQRANGPNKPYTLESLRRGIRTQLIIYEIPLKAVDGKAIARSVQELYNRARRFDDGSLPGRPTDDSLTMTEGMAAVEALDRWLNRKQKRADVAPSAAGIPDTNPTDRYQLGPGRTVTRGERAELSTKEFSIFTLIKQRDSVPLGELMRPAHDDAVWPERYNQDDKQQREKIQKAISRLDGKLTTAGVKISLRVSPPDLIVKYQ